MDRRAFLSGVTVGVLATPLAAQVAPARKVSRIGTLSSRPGPAEAVTSPFVQGMWELGYVEGQNLVIERRDADGHAERLPAFAAELVRSRVEAIVVFGPAPLEPARKATSTIPIVMAASSSDPVAEGLAVSLARPGGNVTGLTYAEPDRFGKQLEYLKTAAGKISRVAVLWDLDPKIYERFWAGPLAAAARKLGIEAPEPVLVADTHALPAAFAQMKRRQADALLVASGGITFPAKGRVAQLAIENRLPGMAAFKEFTQTGLLMSYGPDLSEIQRRAAGYVDRILKGAKPGDLAIELPNKHELMINLSTAKALGLTIPQPLLLRADEVIQ